MPDGLNILIMGATYGSLLASKLILAGHSCTMVCLPDEADVINSDGLRLRIPVKGRDGLLDVHPTSAPGAGSVSAVGPDQASPSDYDLVALAMQEPQYRLPGVRDLLTRTASSGTPAMSIMNMPPLPYLARLPGIDVNALRDCFADPTVWDGLDPDMMTLASPDPQAFKPPEEPLNLLQVTLPTNFQVAAFANPDHTAMLRRIEADILNVRFDTGNGMVELPVKVKVHQSLYVPLAKWAMLLTGNYRCITPDGPQAIRDAVHGDLEQSAQLYDWVKGVCVGLGADPGDLVPFEKYANAASNLLKPSSAARALYGGAPFIERVDRLVQTLARSRGESHALLDKTVSLVEDQLAQNRAAPDAA
ncbi:MAG: hypothetical protein AAGJ28_20835 [Pseudomonadota bacterium]